MGRRKTKTVAVTTEEPAQCAGRLRQLGGSKSDAWNNMIANETINALWFKGTDEESKDRMIKGALSGLTGIDPRDELEGMMAAQMIAAHAGAMECYRRAMHPEQTFAGRSENLTQANKLSRTSTILLEALNRHRGKGQQKVTVEHVNVHAGGQAIVGAVDATGGSTEKKRRNNPMQLAIHLAPRCGARTRSANPCQSPAMRNGRCRMHGGNSPGAPKGNKNAFKHGRYTAGAIAQRRSVSGLIAKMKLLARIASDELSD